MEIKRTADILRLTLKIVESWEGNLPSEIEKDVVLDNLKQVYSGIKHPKNEACFSRNGQPESQGHVPVSEPVKEKGVSCTPDGDIARGTDPEPVDITPEPTPAQNISETKIAASDRPALDEYELDVTEIAAPADSSEDSSLIVNSADEKEEFRENILFDESEVPVKPKLDRRAILSLYGDDAPVASPAAAKREETDRERIIPEAAPISPATQPAPAENFSPAAEEAPSHSEPVAAFTPAAAEEPVPVLGDVLGGGAQTVSDMYAREGELSDVASVIGSAPVNELRKAIGINDKFLIIRNLFDGDADRYDSVIAALEGFDDLDDALIYIHENFNWNPDNEAVKMIIDLLPRKLS